MFYFITAENYFGTPNVALLPDKEGRLVKGSEQIKSTSSSKAMIMHKPGNNKIYQLITIGDDKRARCYEIDSRENGFGNSTNKGGEVVSETILPNAENIGNHIAVIEDEVNQKNYVYMQQYVEPEVQTELPHVKLLAYEFPVSGEIEQHTLAEFDGYSINGDGEIQISPDGNNILLYNLKKKLGGFDHRKVDIIMMKFAGDKLSIIPENTIHASKLGGNYGKASTDFTQSEEHGSNIVFNQHSIILTTPGDIESDKQTRHINTNSNNITQIENIKEKGDIRRGLNNNLYLAGYKKSSLQQNINKIYELTTTGVIGASQVNLEDNDYYLSASLPGQIYRIGTSVNQTVFSRQVGLKQYELTNHLGNVMATVSDIKYSNGTGFDANISSIQNYYPFGSIMEGRLFTGNDYRFGFNGQEKVDEINGVTGSHYTALFWEYDARLGRRWNPDPKPDAWESVYVAFANNPIFYTDFLGDTEDERKKAVEKAKKWEEKSTNTSASYGGKGAEPGKPVDCSGLVSSCVQAAGLPNPNSGSSNGVTNIANNSTKVDFNDIEEGYAVTFNNNKHIGIISGNIERDEEGNVISFSVIGSQSSTGPAEFTVFTDKSSSWTKKTSDNERTNNGYWSPKLGAAYKWDTPDKPAVSNGNNTTVQESTNAAQSIYIVPVDNTQVVVPIVAPVITEQQP